MVGMMSLVAFVHLRIMMNCSPISFLDVQSPEHHFHLTLWHFYTLIPSFHFIVLWLVPPPTAHPCGDEAECLRYFHQRVATATIKLQLASWNSLIWPEGLIQISQMGSRLHDNDCDTPSLPWQGGTGNAIGFCGRVSKSIFSVPKVPPLRPQPPHFLGCCSGGGNGGRQQPVSDWLKALQIY